ncbi:G domain-containing protein [Entamoeba marina]
MSEARNIEEFTSLLVKDASRKHTELQTTFNDSQKNAEPPAVLVVGQSGSGKSSVINTVFDEIVADEGASSATTSKITKYLRPNLTIYDSMGLTHTNAADYVETTKSFLNTTEIHVVWFVLNSASGRIQPFESEICNTLFADFPLLFLLNKCDLSTDADRAALRRAITSLKRNVTFSDKAGIFEIVSRSSASPIINVQRCPQCDGDDLVVKVKSKVATCCHCTTEIDISSQHEELVTATLSLIPTVKRKMYSDSQRLLFTTAFNEGKKRLISMDVKTEISVDEFSSKIASAISGIATSLGAIECSSEKGKSGFLSVLHRHLGITGKITRLFTGNDLKDKIRILAVACKWFEALSLVMWSVVETCLLKIDQNVLSGGVKEALDCLSDFDVSQTVENIELYGITTVLNEIELKVLNTFSKLLSL